VVAGFGLALALAFAFLRRSLNGFIQLEKLRLRIGVTKMEFNVPRSFFIEIP
jgi:hypothetical protein